MEQIFMSTSGKRVAIMDEGNNINVVFLANKRNIQWVGYRKDYHLELCVCEGGGKICLAYINVANELIWDEVGNENRIVLLSDIGNIWNIRNVQLLYLNGGFVLLYLANNPASGRCEIMYTYPEGTRKGKTLVSETGNIEGYKVYFNGEKNIIRYSISDENKLKSYIIDFDGLDEVYIEEYPDDVKKKEKIENQCRQLYEKKLSELESKYKNHIRYMEEKYKKQYDELADFAGKLQEEGKRWRDLYYKMSEQ